MDRMRSSRRVGVCCDGAPCRILKHDLSELQTFKKHQRRDPDVFCGNLRIQRHVSLGTDARLGGDVAPFPNIAADALAHRLGRTGLAFHALRDQRLLALGRGEYRSSRG